MKLHFGHLLALSSLLLAACAAYFSISGLSQLFAGASLGVIIMASGLEFSKIIAASFLHNYWKKISKTLRAYLTIGVVILVLITSAGIYGFLSSAYQKTANNLEMHEGEVGVLDTKITQFQSKIDNNNKLIEMKTKRLNQLTDLRSSQESRLEGRNARSARADITESSSDIRNLNTEIDKYNSENAVLMDSISKYNMGKLDLKSKSKVAGEVGPLKYMAELTGVPMNKIVNWFILLLIFVFDPLAISLVIATNWYFEKRRLGELDNEPKEVKNEILVDPETGEINLTHEPEYNQEFFLETYSDNEEIEVDEEEIVIEENDLEVETPMDIPDEYEDSLTGDTETEVIEEIIETSYTGSTQSDLTELIDNLTKEGEPRKITREDIKEIKQREKGFSVPIPKPKNTIERIGQNKYGDSNNIVFKRDGNK